MSQTQAAPIEMRKVPVRLMSMKRTSLYFSVYYFIPLLGCFPCLAFWSCACLTDFCFCPFSLSFFPPLSPMVSLLLFCCSYAILSGTLCPYDDAIRSMGQSLSAIGRSLTNRGKIWDGREIGDSGCYLCNQAKSRTHAINPKSKKITPSLIAFALGGDGLPPLCRN